MSKTDELLEEARRKAAECTTAAEAWQLYCTGFEGNIAVQEVYLARYVELATHEARAQAAKCVTFDEAMKRWREAKPATFDEVAFLERARELFSSET